MPLFLKHKHELLLINDQKVILIVNVLFNDFADCVKFISEKSREIQGFIGNHCIKKTKFSNILSRKSNQWIVLHKISKLIYFFFSFFFKKLNNIFLITLKFKVISSAINRKQMHFCAFIVSFSTIGFVQTQF